MKKKLITLIVSCVLLSSVAFAKGSVKGTFKVIPPGTVPAAHSAKSITVYEIASFACPHCYKFNTILPTIKKKYGTKVTFKFYPILWNGENPARLFYLAQIKKGNAVAEQVKNEIFSYYHEKGLGQQTYQISVLKYIAKAHGLEKNLEKELQSAPVDAKIKETKAVSKQYKIRGTPSFIINGVLLVEGDDKPNLEMIFDTLLK